MNRQVRYDEFVGIMRRGVIEYADTPEVKFLSNRRKDIEWEGKMEKEDFDHDEDEED